MLEAIKTWVKWQNGYVFGSFKRENSNLIQPVMFCWLKLFKLIRSAFNFTYDLTDLSINFLVV